MTGNLKAPSLRGEVKFKRGMINILNREFALISEEQQKMFYAADLEKVKGNTAVFYGERGREGLLPYLTLTSSVKVKNYEEVQNKETPKFVEEEVIVIARVIGMPFAAEKEKEISVKLDAFKEDKTKKPAEIISARIPEEEIKVLLLPDFIKAPLGLTKKGVEGVPASEVMVDYLNSRLQALLLRGAERELERTLGLESLTLEYNFGKDLRRLMAREEPGVPPALTGEEKIFGIGFVKGFFDKFYIDVRYSQAIEERATEAYSFFNYQITYKLSPIFSIIYYNEPFISPEKGYPYYKLTLKAGYQF